MSDLDQRIEEILRATLEPEKYLDGRLGIKGLVPAKAAIKRLVEERDKALEWLFGDDTGLSSKAICAHMLGIQLPRRNFAPADAADRGRCIRLLNKIPQWWERLDEMAQYESPEYISWSSDGRQVKRDGWAEQVPLIKQESLLNSAAES